MTLNRLECTFDRFWQQNFDLSNQALHAKPWLLNAQKKFPLRQIQLRPSSNLFLRQTHSPSHTFFRLLLHLFYRNNKIESIKKETTNRDSYSISILWLFLSPAWSFFRCFSLRSTWNKITKRDIESAKEKERNKWHDRITLELIGIGSGMCWLPTQDDFFWDSCLRVKSLNFIKMILFRYFFNKITMNWS